MKMNEENKCNNCNKVGQFQDNSPTILYSQGFDDKVYCNDCIPKWWNEKLENETQTNNNIRE